eukprot:351970-Chlamydomonas_euryale.AAC.6
MHRAWWGRGIAHPQHIRTAIRIAHPQHIRTATSTEDVSQQLLRGAHLHACRDARSRKLLVALAATITSMPPFPQLAAPCSCRKSVDSNCPPASYRPAHARCPQPRLNVQLSVCVCYAGARLAICKILAASPLSWHPCLPPCCCGGGHHDLVQVPGFDRAASRLRG